VKVRKTVAVVDDEPGQRRLLSDALERAGYDVRTGETGLDAEALAGEVDLLLLDVRMPKKSGLEALPEVFRKRPELPVVLLTAFIDVRDAVAAMKLGARDYLEKPVDLDELLDAVDDLLGNRPIASDRGLPPGVVCESPLLTRCFEEAARAAETEAPVLLLGESGTGKEVLARHVHDRSARASKPFVVVDCTTLPPELAESELFGHVRGAFTGAERDRIGRFQEADGGTLFLDELGDLPLAMQPKLLRALEGGVIRPVGGEEDVRVSVRIVAATNRDLEAGLRDGTFREDLYFRLSVFPVNVPPLRERPEDVLALAEHFLSESHKKMSPAAQRLLLLHSWPGNVRELRNALSRAAILSAGNQIMPEDLPATVTRATSGPVQGSVLVGDMRAIERQAILEALDKTGGNKTQAAELLGISRRNLIYKLRAYGM
jgi:DNA-binding NtrC family response regulator